MNDITSANSTAVMTIDGILPQGFELDNFATDGSFAKAEKTLTETRMGVDGKMSAGYVPSIESMTISFEASARAVDHLTFLQESMKANKKTYEITLVITVPSMNRVYTFTGGVLKTGKDFPDHKKVLDPVTFGFDFEKMTPLPM